MIEFAILGFGHAGKLHARAISVVGEGRITAIADPMPERRAEAAELFPQGVTLVSDFSEIPPPQGDYSVMIIALPNGLHAGHAVKAMEAGWHVLVEKPLCLNADEGERLLSVSEQTQKRAFVVKQNRFSPSIRWMHSILQEKKLGKLFLVEAHCFWNRDERYYQTTPDGFAWRGSKTLDGGVLFTQFSHFLDILHWVLGPMQVEHARMYNFTHQDSTEFPDSGLVQFSFGENTLGSFAFTTSVWDRNLESSITLIGERGSFRIGGQYMEKLDFCHIQGVEMPHFGTPAEANQYPGYTGSASNHHFIIRNVVDALKGNASETISPAEALSVVRLIQEMYHQAGY